MITRRNLIANASLGAAGLALSPFTEHMRAQAAGKLPKRFVFFTTANGIDPGYLLPADGKKDGAVQISKNAGVDKAVDTPLANMKLPPWLKSLEPLMAKTSLITGQSGKMCRGWHSVSYGTLGAYACGDKGKPVGETIDGALAKLNPGIFPHVGLSANSANGVSAVGPGSALPTYNDPLEAYNTLYGVVSRDPRAQRRNKFDGKLLDFMSSDVKAFERRLPGEQKQKLAHYLAAYEEMGKRHGQLLAMKNELATKAPDKPDGLTDWEAKVEAMCGLVTGALITGLTNVAAINTDGNGANGAVYGKKCGFDKPVGGHGFGHGPTHKRVLPFGYNVSLMANMAKALDAVPEGDGTMLDNTILLMASTSGASHHTRATNFPMVLIGNCHGRLRTGRHIKLPGYGHAANPTIGTIYTSLLHAAGHPRDGFGAIDPSTPKKNQTQPLAELVA
jgi:hypothetical protein